MVECRNQAFILAAEQSSVWQHAGDVQGPDDEDQQQQTSATLTARVRDMLEGGDSFSMCVSRSVVRC